MITHAKASVICFLIATAFTSKPAAAKAIGLRARTNNTIPASRGICAKNGDHKSESPSSNNTAIINNRKVRRDKESGQDMQDAKNTKIKTQTKTKYHPRIHLLP